jgi:DNA-binding LacI/PurR family transcriptional regulator
VAQPVEQMGRELARLVVAAIEGTPGTKRTLLPTRLIVRSTG